MAKYLDNTCVHFTGFLKCAKYIIYLEVFKFVIIMAKGVNFDAVFCTPVECRLASPI